jgi:hypothetical protein
MWIINEVQLLHFDTGIKPSPISEGVMEIWISIHLVRENLTTRRTHGVWDLTYGYILLSFSEVKITPLHSGWNLSSTVITQLLSLSWVTSFSLQQPPRSSESDIRTLSTFPSSTLHLPTISFLAQSQIKVLINFPTSNQNIESQSWKGAISWVVFGHSISTKVLT